MKRLKHGLVIELVNALLNTRCQRIITKVTSDDDEVPSFHCTHTPAMLGAAIGNLYPLIDGQEWASEVAGPAGIGYAFSGEADESCFRLEKKQLVVTRNRSFWFQGRFKHSGDIFETECIDFMSLLRELQDSPGETLFLGDWDDEEEENEALAAFGLTRPCAEPA